MDEPLPHEDLGTVRLRFEKTGPWVRFVSIMGFISSAFTLLFGLALGLAGLAAGNMETASYLIVSPVAALVYGLVAFSLFQYSRAIRRFTATAQLADLELALDTQHRFWRLVGVLVIVVIALFFALFVIAMVIAAAGMAAGLR